MIGVIRPEDLMTSSLEVSAALTKVAQTWPREAGEEEEELGAEAFV
jgi:hypothetical protein